MYGLDQSPPSRTSSYIQRAIAITAVCALLTIIAYLCVYYNDELHLLPPRDPVHEPIEQLDIYFSPIEAAANATLGVLHFEKIVALSLGTAWRVGGLRAAANITGLDIHIPDQPRIAPELAGAFEVMGAEDDPRPSHGSALAWLAHLDLLKHVLQSGWATTLIVEDDVDWDVDLRSKAIMPLAEGVRNYTDTAADDWTTPYGSNWDVLWMGHCGEWSHEDMPILTWPDDTVVPIDEYVGWANVDMKERPLPNGHRTTHPTTNSVCTFAYAVTATGAGKILEHLGSGGGEAFDVALSNACHDKKLECVTIHPEIFHQYEPPSEYGDSSEINVESNGVESDVQGPATMKMGHTANVRNSARCKALYDTTCQQLP